MNKNNDNKLVMNIRITDTKEFNEFKDITLKILQDDSIPYSVREEYKNKVMKWLSSNFDSNNLCNDKFKITCQTCGSNDVSILEDCDCGDDYSYVYGYYLECNVCKENNL